MSYDTKRLRSVAAFCDENGAGEWASYLFSVADEVERLSEIIDNATTLGAYRKHEALLAAAKAWKRGDRDSIDLLHEAIAACDEKAT